MAEESFLTQSVSEVSLEEGEEGKYKEESFNFPPGVDLGTSYGSYLLSRGKSTRRRSKHHSIKPGQTTGGGVKLPAIVPSVHHDITLLLSFLSELCSRLRTNGQHCIALETCLTDLYNIDTALAATPAINKGQLVVLYLQQLTQAIVAITPEIGASSLSTSGDRQREMKAFKRLYQTTEAELVATRNYCQKLQHKLETIEGQAELKQSQLSCELLATRKSLAEANFELQKEKTKAQSAYLLSTQSQRELGKFKKAATSTNFERQVVQENEQLKSQLEEKTKMEERLRKRWNEDRLKLAQLIKKSTLNTMPPPLHHSPPRHSLSFKGGPLAAGMKYQGQKLHRKPLQQINGLHKPHIEGEDHIPVRNVAYKEKKRLIVPLATKWDELVHLAKFPDERVATETKEILNKQGLLHN